MAVVATGAWLVLRDGAGDGRRAAVEGYVREVNAVQAGAAIELDGISRTYERIRLAPKELQRAQPELEAAVATLRRLAAELRAVSPPPEAERVHAELLEVLRMQVSLAVELAELARYVPQWAEHTQRLDAATQRLRSELREAKTSDAQRDAFAAYAASVGQALERLSALDAPAVLEPPRRQELARLRRVHGLGEEVRDALAAGRSDEAAPLFDRLADAASTANANRTQRAAVAAYNRRIERLTAQRTVVERELATLAERLD